MILRFTLTNEIEGDHLISDPQGWEDIDLTLDRDADYHSLVEMVTVPITFYRSSDNVDGGYDYVINVEATQGIDAQIGLLIECSDDDGLTFETFFNGLLELETIKDISDAESYKVECNIVRNDLWSKFFSRKSQQVDLNSSVSLDNEDLTPISEIQLSLPCQTMRQVYFGQVERDVTVQYLSVPNNDYGQLDFYVTNLSEIKEKYNYPLVSNTARPAELFALEYAGSYLIDINVYTSTTSLLSDPTNANLHALLQINDDTAITLTKTNIGTPGLDGRTRHSYNNTLTLKKGDFIRLYFRNQTGGNYTWVLRAGLFDDSYMRITSDTVHPSSQTDAFLLRDAAESILSKIVSRDNVLFSNYLGDETPTACGANFAIMKGLHVRGYTMFDKPMFMSFDEWWQGANPILNLGLGYEEIDGQTYIRIEDKLGFYDDDPSITFDNVDKIVRTYDKKRIIKNIALGYETWSAESLSGIDDPQSRRSYNTRFKIVGQDFTMLSRFVAASLAIEQTRRFIITENKDWRLDNNFMIIELNTDNTPFQPALNEKFDNITGLLNASTRYNLGITVARNFIRWQPLFNGALQTYIDNSPCEYFRFSSGEGNFSMTSEGTDSCNLGELGESQDICVTDEFYHTPIQFEFEADMTWPEYKTIRDNKRKAILVSNTTEDHKICHIEKLIWNHFDGKAKIVVWLKDTNFEF